MRVLIAGANYTPEVTSVAPFTTGLAEHFAARGHDVTVATTFAFYPMWRWYEPPPHWRTQEILNGVDVRRTKIVLPPRRTAIWRIVFDSSIALTSALTALSIPRVDITICLSPPVQTILVGAALRFRLGKLVMLVKDLPTRAAESVGMLHEGGMLRVGRTVERAAYKQADHIVVISRSFSTYIQSLGVLADRISEIPDWGDLTSVRPTKPDREMRDRLGAGANDFLVVHSGNMGAKQDLLNVVSAAARITDRRIKLALVGDGTERGRILEAIARQLVQNIKVLPLQPNHEFPRVLAAADVLLVNQAPMVVDSVLPSKLLSYMAAGRPVLAAAHANSTTAELVRTAACGVVTEPGRPEALAAALESMASRTSRDRALGAMGKRGRAYVEKHFERDSILSRWDDLIVRLASTGSRR